MKIFYMETKDNLSDRIKGPPDPINRWPTIHKMFQIECETEEEAIKHFEDKFPKNVACVYSFDPYVLKKV